MKKEVMLNWKTFTFPCKVNTLFIVMSYCFENNISISDIQKLAISALISGIADILSITDTIIVGNMSENATISLGAVGIVGSFISMLIWVFGQTRSVISFSYLSLLGETK